MTKRKLTRFAENDTFDHLFQQTYDELMQGFRFKGKWGNEYFKNDHPIILELGCGKGEYTVGLSRQFRDQNFIGVDIKGARMWRGCKTVQEEGIKNVGFIRTRIGLIDHFFDKDEVSEIWLTFPDPQPRENRSRKRLTSPMFLGRYQKFLKPGGVIHLKTDNTILFASTIDDIEEEGHELIYSTWDLYHSDYEGPVLGIKTFYEERALDTGVPIKYLQFRLKNNG